MDTYFHVDSFKCTRCYKCVRLCMNTGGLGALTLGWMGEPNYEHDYVGCHHCDLPIKDRRYDKDNGVIIHMPCAKICPTHAITIERW